MEEPRAFKKTFHYGSHHIEQIRWVEGGLGPSCIGGTLILQRHIIDGWDRIDDAYLPHIFKYLDEVDSRRCRVPVPQLKKV